jgi:hypothetical protein
MSRIIYERFFFFNGAYVIGRKIVERCNKNPKVGSIKTLRRGGIGSTRRYVTITPL